MLERVEREVLDLVSLRVVDPTTKRVYTPGMISKALDQLSSGNINKNVEDHHNGGGGGDGKKPMWTGFTANKSAKIQALDAIKALIAWQPIPVMRARMRLRITCPVSMLKHSVKTTPKGDEKDGSGKDHDGGGGGGGGGGKKGGGGGKKAKGRQQKHQNSDGESDVPPPPVKTTTTMKDKILGYIESIETQEVTGGDEWEVVGFVQPGAFRVLNEFIGNETRGHGRVEILDMAVTHED